MEIATVLKRDIRVIPVLVDGPSMPRSISPAKPETPGETPKVVYPLAPKVAEPEREKPGTGGKRSPKQVTAFLVIAVTAGLIYLVIRLSQSPQPQATPATTATPRPWAIATPTVEEREVSSG